MQQPPSRATKSSAATLAQAVRATDADLAAAFPLTARGPALARQFNISFGHPLSLVKEGEIPPPIKIGNAALERMKASPRIAGVPDEAVRELIVEGRR